jgi:hypothetical protein
METCHSNARVHLYGDSRLHFVTKAGAPHIFDKLRRTKTPSISFLSSTKLGACLGDADASCFTRSEMIAFGHVSYRYLLFEFHT